jgi:hypothetical protein
MIRIVIAYSYHKIRLYFIIYEYHSNLDSLAEDATAEDAHAIDETVSLHACFARGS